MIRATYRIDPPGGADLLAVQASTGMATPVAGTPEPGTGVPGTGVARPSQGVVVREKDGLATIEFPSSAWEGNVALLVASLVAGEGSEMAALTQCRLVDLALPDGWLPGPRYGAPSWPGGVVRPPGGSGVDVAIGVGVGVIVKPSLGLSPTEVAGVIAAAVRGGARFVKDDEMLGDPAFCPLEDRVKAAAAVLEDGVVYCANVTGPTASLLDRARRVVELGATGVLVNAWAQGLDSVLALREADLGVPILAHRAGSGPLVRNPAFGATGAVLAGLVRLCGADYAIAGGFGGKLFETDAEVVANIAALRGPCGGALPSVALVGGAVGPDNARAQADRAGPGTVVLLGSRAYGHPGGIEVAVRSTIESLQRSG